MRFLSVFDPTNRDQPTIRKDHPRLSGSELEAVLRYLDAGVMVLRTTAMEKDLLDPTAELGPRMSSFTDGEWIWDESVPFYVEKHGLSPGADFLNYCVARSWIPRKPTQDEKNEALRLILG
jgi:hypothetical protein